MHQNTEIERRDMDQISFVNVFATTLPCPAHAAVIEHVRENAFDHLAKFAHGLPADVRVHSIAVPIHRSVRFVVAVPAQIASAWAGLGDARFQLAVAEVFQTVA